MAFNIPSELAYFGDSNAPMAVITAFSKYLSRNFACFASGKTTCKTLNAWILQISSVELRTSPILISALTPRSERTWSELMSDRMEYGRAADRRVIDKAS